MDINDLKADWQNAGFQPKNESSLHAMVNSGSNAALKNTRIKLLIEAFSLTAFLFVYYDAFDGNSKPLYVNLLLVSSVLLYIAGNLVSYLFIKQPVQGPNLRISLQNRLRNIRFIFGLSIFSSLVYTVTLLLFFGSKIAFNNAKYFAAACLFLALMFIFNLSIRQWKNTLGRYRQLVKEFE